MSGFSSDARQKGSCIRDFTHDIKHGFLSFPSGVAAVPAGDVTLPEQDKAVVKRQMPAYRARARTLTSRASALRGQPLRNSITAASPVVPGHDQLVTK